MRRLGIDIGGTKTLCVVTEGGDHPTVVDERRVPTDPHGNAVTTIIELVRSFDDVASVGVGIAGLVSRDGSVAVTTHLPGVRDLSLGQQLADELGIPVAIDNDATCATVAEWRVGAARGFDDVLMVTLGTGIGGGAVVNGRVARGTNGYAGEFGHMVVQRGGPDCPCGRRGCWESYASGGGLSRLAGGIAAEQVVADFLAGDERAMRVVDEFADWVVLGLYNLVHIHDPACIVLGGGLGSRSEILDVVVPRFAAGPTGHAGRAMPRIVRAELGDRAGAIGAALVGAGD